MTTHNEHDAKETSHAKIDVDSVADAGAAPAKGARAKQAMQKVGHYLMLIVVPLIAVAALALSVMAIKTNGDSQAQLESDAKQIGELSASLSAAKAELDRMKMSALKDKTIQTESLAKQEEIIKKIVQNITPIQTKLKISPTLEHQLAQAVSAPVAPPTPVAAAEPAPTAHTAAPAHAPAAAHAATPTTTKPAEPKHAAPAPTPAPSKSTTANQTKGDDKIVHPQVRAMKEAIEQYNKK